MDNPGNDRQALAHIKTRHTNPTFSDTCTPRPLGTNDALPVAISKRVRRIMRVRFLTDLHAASGWLSFKGAFAECALCVFCYYNQTN